MYRYRELLMSLFASAMLTSGALQTSQAVDLASVIDPAASRKAIEAVFMSGPIENWQTFKADGATSEPSIMLVSAPGRKAPITPEKLQALIRLLNANEDIQPLAEKLTVALGLTHPFTRKNALYEDGAGRHGISVGVSDSTRLVFYLKDDNGIRIYAATLSGELVSAASFINGVATPLTLTAARAGFETELRVWNAAQIPDTSSASNS